MICCPMPLHLPLWTPCTAVKKVKAATKKPAGVKKVKAAPKPKAAKAAKPKTVKKAVKKVSR